jgi:hypothetical protein
MTERERDRNAARRLAILRHAREVTGNGSISICPSAVARRLFRVALGPRRTNRTLGPSAPKSGAFRPPPDSRSPYRPRGQ